MIFRNYKIVYNRKGEWCARIPEEDVIDAAMPLIRKKLLDGMLKLGYTERGTVLYRRTFIRLFKKIARV